MTLCELDLTYELNLYVWLACIPDDMNSWLQQQQQQQKSVYP